jgi:hypothetical protein
MRNIELEGWVVQIAERVKANQPIEDSRVELKAQWPDHYKAARRVAGHLNASREEQVLWLIGVDETQRLIIGASRNDFADWWARVQSEFEGVSPSVRDLNVPFDGKTIVALLFESDRAPYVVRTRASPEYEVPWRDGTRVRSATRQDLIAIYAPAIAKPTVDVRTSLVCRRVDNGKNTEFWGIEVELYIIPKAEERLVVPYYQCSGWIKADGWNDIALLDWIHINPGANSKNMDESNAELTVRGPGAAFFIGRLKRESTGPKKLAVVEAYFSLSFANATSPVSITLPIMQVFTPADTPSFRSKALNIIGTGDLKALEFWQPPA